MKKIFCYLAIVSALALASGCAARRYPVQYRFDDKMYMSDRPLPYTVMVGVFKDERPLDEREGNNKIPGFHLYLKDAELKPDVALQASRMLTEHLQKSRLFNKVIVRDLSGTPELWPEAIKALEAEGVDIAITGSLKHLYGFQSGTAGAAVVLGVAAVFVEAMVNPKDVGAIVEYDNVAITDIRKNEALWQGNIKHELSYKDTWYKGPYGYAMLCLKEANNKFAQKLKEVLTEIPAP